METIHTPIGTKLIGTNREAEQWIRESSLYEKDKALLLQFTRRLPTLEYQRWQEIRSDFGPAWYRSLRNVLEGVHRKGPLWLRFDSSKRFSRLHAQEPSSIWYHTFTSHEPTSDYASVSCSGHQLVFVGHWQEGDWFLAFKADDDDDCGIYTLRFKDIHPDPVYQFPVEGNPSAGEISPDAMHIVFDSYCELLSHVAAVKIGGIITESLPLPQTAFPEKLIAFIRRLKEENVEFFSRHQEDVWGCRYLGDGRFEIWSENFILPDTKQFEIKDEADVFELFLRYSIEKLEQCLIKKRNAP